jgi:hypothetical protein
VRARVRGPNITSQGDRPHHAARESQPSLLNNLVRISDDDADGIISAQRLKNERRYSLDRVLRENAPKLDR